MKHAIIYITLLLLTPWPSYAKPDTDQFHSHADILASAEQCLLADTVGDDSNITIQFTPLDHRLKLARCQSPLEAVTANSTGNKGKATVEVRCPAPKPWKLYVTANIQTIGPVVVAKRDLSRGSAIGTDDVELVSRDTTQLLRGYFESPSQVVGSTLRRNLRRNQVVSPSQLVVRKAITRGQMVNILAGQSGIEVRMKGKALRSGNPGELIPVQNLSSEKKLQARIITADSVRVE